MGEYNAVESSMSEGNIIPSHTKHQSLQKFKSNQILDSREAHDSSNVYLKCVPLHFS